MSAPWEPTEGCRPLTRAEMDAELRRIDLSAGSQTGRVADLLSGDLPGDGRDLLHEAISRSLVSRECPENMTVAQFLRGVMRSIASTARRSRERRGENHIPLPVEEVAERLATGGYTVCSADEVLEVERIREVCAAVLEQLAAVSPTQAALIDAIGLGLRGEALADHLGITACELATVRRALKRHVQRIWPEVEERLA